MNGITGTLAMDKEQEHRIEQKVERFMVGEKAAAWLIGTIVLFVFGNLWMMKDDISKLQADMSELRGQQSSMMQTIRDFTQNGSMTAQQLKLVTEDIRSRISVIEGWMNKGDRFTKDDGLRLESRIRDLETKKH